MLVLALVLILVVVPVTSAPISSSSSETGSISGRIRLAYAYEGLNCPRGVFWTLEGMMLQALVFTSASASALPEKW